MQRGIRLDGVDSMEREILDIDLDVEALRRANEAIGNSIPTMPRTMVKLPENHGGERELNAGQVRAIVRYLDLAYWGKMDNLNPLNLLFHPQEKQLFRVFLESGFRKVAKPFQLANLCLATSSQIRKCALTISYFFYSELITHLTQLTFSAIGDGDSV